MSEPIPSVTWSHSQQLLILVEFQTGKYSNLNSFLIKIALFPDSHIIRNVNMENILLKNDVYLQSCAPTIALPASNE